MKFNVFTFSILLSTLFFSCSQTEDLDLPTINKASGYELSENDVLNLINGFSGSQSSSRAAISPSIKASYYLDTPSTLESRSQSGAGVRVYQVDLNTADKGFALVSGDKRMPCIIAYSEKGELNDTLTNKGAAMMIKNAEGAFLQAVYNADINVESRSTVVTPTGEIVASLEPVVAICWEQGVPYNALMPASSSFTSSNYGGKFPTGCTAVSVAQLLSCFEPYISKNGVYINWTELKKQCRILTSNSEAVKKQAATLMRYIADGIRVVYNEHSGTSASINNIISFLKGMGFSISGGESMNAAVIVNSLNRDPISPVLVTGSASSGSSHCWILDGYQKRKNGSQMNIYIHAHFGWGGMSDGYYLVNSDNKNMSFDTGFMHFNSNLKIYPYINK